MTAPLRNTIYDRIKDAGSITDVDLYKMLVKEGLTMAEDRYNKTLLDLEILGIIKVSWITKDERRIEVVQEHTSSEEEKTTEDGYEASFPGFEK